jgi:hypothetical protein
MGLVHWGRLGLTENTVPAHRLVAKGMAGLLAGVAAITLLAPPASAQQAQAPTDQQQAETKKAEAAKAGRA